MQPLTPVYTAPLLRPLLAELLELLRGLSPEQWEAPTVAGAAGEGEGAAAVVRATADAAWRLLYNALPSPIPPAAVYIEGDRRLAEPLLRTRSIVM